VVLARPVHSILIRLQMKPPAIIIPVPPVIPSPEPTSRMPPSPQTVTSSNQAISSVFVAMGTYQIIS
jgi:hypothetical protein